jgi:hypothetical protein
VTVSPDELTGTEQAVLLVLMAECRAVRNPELETLGPTLDKRGRERLIQKGLVASTRVGGAFVHELTDDGWATCRRIVGAEVPPRPSGQGKALYTLLRGLDRYLNRKDAVLADVFEPVEADAEVVPDPGTPPLVDAEQLVRDAYLRLARRPGGWVALVHLRAELPQLPHPELDAVLRRMYRVPGVHLIPEENQ